MVDKDGQWLVIYASYHQDHIDTSIDTDQGGKYIWDGFQVCTLSLLKCIYLKIDLCRNQKYNTV